MAQADIAAPAAQAAPGSDRPQTRELTRAFLHNRSSVIGGILLLIVLIVAVFGTWLAPQNPITQNLLLANQGPGAAAWLGRDEFGRDILSRILAGAHETLLSSAGAVLLAAVLGTATGVIAGLAGRLTDAMLMRLMDLVLSFPYFLLAILIVAMAGPDLRNAAIAIGVTFIPQYARVVRGATRDIAGLEYIEAARAAGVGKVRIALRHILPNVSGPVIVLSTVSLAVAVVGISSLSFLGMGAQPPTPEWGAMLAEGREYLYTAPHISVVPGVAIMITVLAINLVGDGLQDALDPKSR